VTAAMSVPPSAVLLDCFADLVGGCDVLGLSDEVFIAEIRAHERLRRQMVARDHVLVAELIERIATAQIPARDARTFLVDCLRLSPGEATARVRAAQDLGPRVTLLGEALPPRFAAVAAAQAAGEVSGAQAKVIIDTVTELPDPLRAEHAADVEVALVAHARTLHPGQLARAGQRITAHLNPDGLQPSEAEHERRRDAQFRIRTDRSGEMLVRFQPEVAAQYQAWFDTMAQPRSTTHTLPDGTTVTEPDDRTPGQRRHDALQALITRALNQDLPMSGGTPTTVLLTIDFDQLKTRLTDHGLATTTLDGLVATSHGNLLTPAEALRLAGQAQLIPVITSKTGGVLAYGRTRRVASEGQRYALIARDRGCTAPGCDQPPEHCEAHHITPWNNGGPTDLHNLALACYYHHDNHEKLGWTIVMQNGHPWWIPPPWIDPHQVPIQNTMHHPDRLLPELQLGSGATTNASLHEIGPHREDAPILESASNDEAEGSWGSDGWPGCRHD
jgi:hypothetical protein